MTFLHTTLNIVLSHAATRTITRYLSHNLYKSSCPCPHISPHYYATTTLLYKPTSKFQSSTPQCSKCPNHIILPRLTTSATLSTPIESSLRLLSSNDTPQIHLTIDSFARHMLNGINVRDTTNSLSKIEFLPTFFMQTLHGSLPEASTWPMLTRHLMIFVLPACPFFIFWLS